MSGFKVKVNFDQSKLKKILESRQKLIHGNIVTVVRTEAIPHLIDMIMDGYDGLSDRMSTLPEDPTNPSNWRTAFKTKLDEDLNRNLTVTERGLIIRLGDKEFLGYTDDEQGDPDDTMPLTWLVYYLEGLSGEWAFISRDVYKEKRTRVGSKLGRFGDGFMISKDQFEKENWGKYISFEEARHPFSGYAPVDIFTEALNEFRFKPFIEKAIKASKEGRKL
jgi:hypothetical protein